MVYTNRIRQFGITVYPSLNKDTEYLINGKELLSGKQIDTQGIYVPLDGNYTVKRVSLEKNKR